MLLPKPDPKNLENGWSDGREVQRLLEEKQEALSAMVRKVEGLATVEPAQQAELESLLTEVEALDQALDALPT